MLHSYVDGFWKNNITQKAYSNFGYFGSFGIEDGVNHIIEGRVRTQSELIGNVIEWTPSDHMDYSSFDPYINFFNMNQSDNLLESTSDKTKNFIAKSILGYDLLGKEEIDFNLENINGKHPKKYYVGKTTRGTNYIDSITDTNVNFITYKSDDGMSNNIVRLDMPYPCQHFITLMKKRLAFFETSVNIESILKNEGESNMYKITRAEKLADKIA